MTWQQGETYGTHVLWYDIQLRNTTGSNSYATGWTTLHTVSEGVLTASGNTTFEQVGAWMDAAPTTTVHFITHCIIIHTHTCLLADTKPLSLSTHIYLLYHPPLPSLF